MIGRFGENTLNENGWRLIQLCEQFELKIMNRRKDQETYSSSCNVQKVTLMRVHHARVQRRATCGRDHHLLKAKTILLKNGIEIKDKYPGMIKAKTIKEENQGLI